MMDLIEKFHAENEKIYRQLDDLRQRITTTPVHIKYWVTLGVFLVLLLQGYGW